MPEHLDSDRLILLALAEASPDGAENAHLAGCADCRTEMGALRHVAELGRETQGLADFPPPPDRVWAGIAAEVARASNPAIPVVVQPAIPVAVQPDVPAPLAPHSRRHARPGSRSSARPRRWAAPLVAAVAAAVVGVAGTVAVVQYRHRAPAVTAHADLSPLKIAPATARGEAEILADDNLRLDVRNLPPTTGYYQVWLIDPDDFTQMVPVGILNATPDTITLPIAPTTDLTRYRLVDISAQLYGGDGKHSGKSLLRGTLAK